VADESSASLDIKRLTGSSDLLEFLEKESLLQNSDVFLHEFLALLIAYLKDKDSDYPLIQIKATQLVAAEIFDHLPDLLTENAFLEALQLTGASPDRIRTVQADFDISFLVGAEKLDDKTSLTLRTVEKTNSYEGIEKIKRFYRQIKALRGETFQDDQPEYAQALQALLTTEQANFDQEKAKVRESSSVPSGDIKLSADIQSQLTAKWKVEADADTEKKEKGQVQDLQGKAKKALREELEKWSKAVFALEDSDAQQKIATLQLQLDIQGLPGKKGLLELFLLWSGTGSLSDFLQGLEQFCIHLIEPFNARRGNTSAEQASLDLEVATEKLESALEKFREYLEEVRKKKVEAAEKAYSDSVAAALLGISTPESSTVDDGGSADSDEPFAPSTEAVSLDALVSRWQQASEALISAWSFIEKAPEDDSKKRAILSLLRENNLQTNNLLAGNFDFSSIFASLSPEARQKSHQQAQTILELLPEFYPEGKETIPSPEAVSQPLQTAFGEDTAKDAQGLKLMSLGQISRSKAELVAFTLLQLQRRLEAEGYSAAEIRAYIELYEAQISAQIWMKILEKNGLQQALTLQDLVLIEKEITDQYLVFITKAFPPKNTQARRTLPALDDEDLLRAYLANQGLDANYFLGQFSHENLQKALLLTQEFSRLSFEERVAIVTGLLQGKMDQATAANLAKVFIALASGGNVTEYSGILDALAFQMHQKNWSQLSPSEQNRLSALLDTFYDNMEVFGLVFGLSELRLLQTEVSSLQSFLARMQKFANAKNINSSPLLRSIGSFAPVTADEPAKRGWNDAVLDGEANPVSSTRNVTLQVSVLFAVQMQTEVRDNLLTLVMQRPISMQEFGGLLEFAQTGVQPTEPIDGRLLAQFQNFTKMQQEDPEAFAAQQQQAYQQFAQAEYHRKRLQVAFKLIKAAAKAYAGNPMELAALLSDKESREIIQKEMLKWGVRIGGAAAGGATYAVLAPLINIISGVTSALTSLGLMGQQVGTAAGELASSGSVLGSEGMHSAALGANKELVGLQNAAAKAWTSASQIPGQISTATSTLGIGKSLAVMAFSSVFGPILFAGFLTIIVITVIGSSLNDLPSGVIPGAGVGGGGQGRLGRFNGTVCWPTDGHIGQLDTRAHNTWDIPTRTNAGSALDISGDTGTPIYTPYAGMVSEAGYYEAADNEGYGYWVRIEADIGVSIFFAHMAEMPQVKKGDRVEAGTPLGLMGQSGGDWGVHLHYEVFDPTLRVSIRDIIPPTPQLPDPDETNYSIEIRVGMCGGTTAETLDDADTVSGPRLPPATTPAAPGQPAPEDLLNGDFSIP